MVAEKRSDYMHLDDVIRGMNVKLFISLICFIFMTGGVFFKLSNATEENRRILDERKSKIESISIIQTDIRYIQKEVEETGRKIDVQNQKIDSQNEKIDKFYMDIMRKLNGHQ